MTNIYLQKLDPNNNTTSVYVISNNDTFNIEYDSPVSPMPLPQNNDTQNVLVKIEGNSSQVNIVWTIKQESSNIGYNANDSYNVQTIWDQVNFFEKAIVPITLSDKYQITVADSMTLGSIHGSSPNAYYQPTFTPTTPYYQKLGTLIKESFTLSGTSPVTFSASIAFMTGNVITAYETNTPSEPQNVVLTTPTTGTITSTWTVPTDIAGGGGLGTDGSTNTVTGYYIQRRTGLQTIGNLVADTRITVTPNTTGATTYKYWVVAKNSGGQIICSIGMSITNGNATPNNTITWTAVDGATSYDILRGATTTSIALSQTGTSYTDNNGSTTSYSLTATQTAFKNTGLTSGATYYYTISATNAQGIGVPAVEVSKAAT